MNLLKQTALILGLISLSISGWTLYRSWRKKIAIQFSVICFFIAVWALSFVAHVTLQSRLSYDIHRFFNIWLAPFGILILSQFLMNEDRFTRFLKKLSWIGAGILSLMVVFSLQSFYDRSSVFSWLVRFWPITLLIQFLNVAYQDVVLKRPVSFEFVASKNRAFLYVGTGCALLFCTFDHVPELGFVIPSIGNLFLAAFLVFTGQVISPQKFLRMEALISRFLAVLMMALVITGFFALMYQYVSESFPLFLLNSFLISFATIVLWTPLVTFFRYLSRTLFKTDPVLKQEQFELFRSELSAVADLETLQLKIKQYFKIWIGAEDVQLVLTKQFPLPLEIENFFLNNERQKETPILHRQLVQLEIDQELTKEFRVRLKKLLRFLNDRHCDVVFPILSANQVQAIVLVKTQTTPEENPEEWSLGFAFYTKIYFALQDVTGVLERLFYIGEAKEKEKLILLGEMAAGLAHEVRNPLGAISGAAELLTGEAGPWANVIKEEVARLNRLVSQFLDLSQIPSYQAEECNLIEIIQVTLRNLSRSKATHEKLIFNPAEQEVLVYVVPDHVQQVLINLIQNAFQSGSPTVEIRIIQMHQDEKKWVGFEVLDLGSGIPEHDLEKVFQPFYTTFTKGTGLGLSICRRLISHNGGFMEISSRVNEGTTVKVYLPYER